MDHRINTLYQNSHNPITLAASVNVLVVDDDVVCFFLVAMTLGVWKYQGIKGRLYVYFLLQSSSTMSRAINYSIRLFFFHSCLCFFK